MADFRETLEVVKNSTCFLSYSYCKVKEDLAVDYEDDTLPNPPKDIEFANNATLGEVADLIERFSCSEDQCYKAMQELLDTGRTKITDEY